MNGSTENGSEKLLELGKDAFLHPPSSKFVSKKICLGGRTLNIMWLTKDSDTAAEEEQEFKVLVERLYKTCRR